MTPLELEVFLWFACCVGEHPSCDPKLFRSILAKLYNAGVLENRDQEHVSYQATEKGLAWLQMILDTPYPVSKWVDPR